MKKFQDDNRKKRLIAAKKQGQARQHKRLVQDRAKARRSKRDEINEAARTTDSKKKKLMLDGLVLERRKATRDERQKIIRDAVKQHEAEEIVSAEEAARRELASRELARRSLLHYTERSVPGYMTGWVHEDVTTRLERFVQDVAERRSPRLMLWMPPRMGKSEIVSVRLPSWALGHHPSWEFISSSYSIDLPVKFSRTVRAQIQSKDYQHIFPKTQLAKDRTGVEDWGTTMAGGYRAAGTSGGITGMGAHILSIDDPVKDREEADSQTIRDRTYNWYSSTAYTRLAPGGGVLLTQCLTGDSMVLMADASERRIDSLRPGDEVATAQDGELRRSVVEKQRSTGRDKTLLITTSSGKIVQANGRHPFLTYSLGGLKWTRAKDLKLTSQIVTLKADGESGSARPVQSMDVIARPRSEACAPRTITKLAGLRAIAHRLRSRLQKVGLVRSSGTGTELRSMTGTGCSKSRAESVPSAVSIMTKPMPRPTGTGSSASTTAMIPIKSEPSSATSATCLSEEQLPLTHSDVQQSTSTFTLDEVVSIDEAGTAEVFDIQVAGTGNFIANGVLVHNTRWHDDDLSGRLATRMREDLKELDEDYRELQEMLNHAKTDMDISIAVDRMMALEEKSESIDRWEIVKYPALATQNEYISSETFNIYRESDLSKDDVKSATLRPLRKEGEALHEGRWPRSLMLKYKRTLTPGDWSALYQQDPTPDEGAFFQKGYVHMTEQLPHLEGMTIFNTWDLAIGLKEHNDWSVGAVGALDWEDNLWLLHLYRVKLDTDDLARLIIQAHVDHKAEYTGIEKGQLELALRPSLARIMSETGNYISLLDGRDALVPLTDKMVRARPLQGRMQAGKLLIPNNRPWTDWVVTELLRFPNGVNDDIVDALAWLARVAAKTAPPPKPKEARNQQLDTEGWRTKLHAHTRLSERGNFMSR